MEVKLYAEVIIFGIIVILLMLLSIKRNLTVLLGEKLFAALILSQLAMLVINGLAKIPEGSLHRFARPVLIFANTAYCFQLGVIGFLWLIYADYRINADCIGLKRRSVFYAVPCGALLLLSLVNLFTGWVFYIDSSNRVVQGVIFVPVNVVMWLMLLIPAAMALQRAAREPLSYRRQEYITEALYILPPLFGFILHFIFGLENFMWIIVTCSMLLIFFEMQGRQISIDALTGVNNRRTFNKYIETFADNPKQKTVLALFIIDINDFKEINDIHGHSAGDSALIVFASLLRKVCGRRNCFLARYGGDEFAVISTDIKNENPGEIAAEIKSEVKAANNASALPFKLTCSVGYAIGKIIDAKGIEALINEADSNMYKMKREYKSAELQEIK